MRASIEVLSVVGMCIASAYAEPFEVYVPEGATMTWAEFKAQAEIKDFSGRQLNKTGAGTFDPSGDELKTDGVNGIVVKEGRYIVSSDAELGVERGAVTVESGATLIADGNSNNIASRTITLSGVGSSEEYPALRLENVSATKIANCEWKLGADASIYIASPSEAGGQNVMISYGSVNFEHVMTVSGTSGSRFGTNPGFHWYGSGLNGMTFTGDVIFEALGTATEGYWIYASEWPAGDPTFTFRDSSAFAPQSGQCCALVKKVAFLDQSALKPSAQVELFFSAFSGLPEVNENVVGLTIENTFDLTQSDIVNGRSISLPTGSSLSFGENARLNLSGVGAWLAAKPSGWEYVLASASTVSGLPTLEGSAVEYFTIENSGTELKLVRKEHAGKYVAFVEGMDLSAVEDNTTLLFESRDYYPGGQAGGVLDLSALTSSGVTLLSFGTTTICGSLALGEAENLTVDGFVFKNTPGPAVVATGTSGLTLKNLVLDNVAGAYEGAAYPFAFIGVSDLEVANTAYAFTASPEYAAQAYLSGGSQKVTSEVQANAFCVYVGAGKTNTWDQVVTGNGLSASYYSGRKLAKVGPGMFAPGSDAVRGAGITGILLAGGSYAGSSDAEFGVAQAAIVVTNDATLVIDGLCQNNLCDRSVYFFGNGSSREFPAVRLENNNIWRIQNNAWYLKADVSFYNSTAGTADGVNDVFCYGNFYADGHALRLDGVPEAAYRFSKGIHWHDGGSVTVGAGVRLVAIENGGPYWHFDCSPSDNKPVFTFEDDAALELSNADILELAANSVFAPTAKIKPTAATDIAFDNLTGAPVLGENVTSLTINSRYTLRQADAESGVFLNCSVPIAMGEGAIVSADAIPLPRTVTVFHSTAGISGKPVTSQDLKAAHLRVRAADENTWLLARFGLCLILQ